MSYSQGLARHFTKKQEKTFREAFSHFDVNNDGEVVYEVHSSLISTFFPLKIDKQEIIRVMSNLGVEVSINDIGKIFHWKCHSYWAIDP